MKSKLQLKLYLREVCGWTEQNSKEIAEAYFHKGISGVYGSLEGTRRHGLGMDIRGELHYSETKDVKQWFKANDYCWIRTIRT